MDNKKLDTGSKDAISWLPEEVLGDILSLVPTKLAASTSLLSTKWRNVFALVHNLDFDESDMLQPEEGKEKRDVIRESFRNFVDRTLALQCASPIKKFSLKCHIDEDSQMAYVAPWIRKAVERGVMELDFRIKPRYGSFELCELPDDGRTYGEICLPYEFFTSKTLVKLTLGTQINLEKLPPDVSLPALKSLFIDSVYFDYKDLCYVLLPGCPVLEDLVVRHKYYEGLPYCISSRTIKKLSVHYDVEFEIGTMSIMSFDAPSLVSLDYSDYALCQYRPVNLESASIPSEGVACSWLWRNCSRVGTLEEFSWGYKMP